MRRIDDPAAVALARMIALDYVEDVGIGCIVEGRSAFMFTAQSRRHDKEKDGAFNPHFTTYWFFPDNDELRVEDDCIVKGIDWGIPEGSKTVIVEDGKVQFDRIEPVKDERVIVDTSNGATDSEFRNDGGDPGDEHQ